MGNYYVPQRRNTPPCFPTPEIFGRWREMARSCNAGIDRDGYCADCTPQYRDRMVARNRCSYPMTLFEVDQDGMVKGRRRIPVFPSTPSARVTIPETECAA